MTTGILLNNLGTPSLPTPAAVRAYLKEFLSDQRVVEIPKPIWRCLLNGIILPLRGKSSSKLYSKIWLPEGSPLLVNTQRLATALQSRLNGNQARDYHVIVGMCYGKPSLADALQALQQDCEKIIVLPLYPQFSATTTAASFDAISRYYSKQRYIPNLQFIHGYAANDIYIAALAQSVTHYWQQHGRPNKLLISFHGIPVRNVKAGDPYALQCQQTADLLAKRLNLSPNEWTLVYQSRFGRSKWLTPYALEVISSLGQQKIERIDVICPGFATDCLETLEEVNIGYRNQFQNNGGKDYHYIPALNDSAMHVDVLVDLVAGVER